MSPSTEVGQGELQLIAFGDLAGSECLEPLQRLLHLKQNIELEDFFLRVTFRLRQYLGTLQSPHRELFPRFTTLIDILSSWEEVPGRPALHLFLLSVLQCGQFIHYYGGNEGRVHPSAADACILGNCAGKFAAAAASCSRSISQFVPLAVEAALAAFRTGLTSQLVGEMLYGRQGDLKAWSVLVSPMADASIEGLLDLFMDSNKAVKSHERLWIGARAPADIATLSGKPAALSDFVNANKKRLRAKMLKIFSPYHAPHLFSVIDVDEIMEGVSVDIFVSTEPRITMLPPSTSDTNDDFIGRLREAVEGVLREQLDLGFMFESCGRHLTQTGHHKCRLITMSYDTTSTLCTTLSNNFGIQVEVEDASKSFPSIASPAGRCEQSKIAIVGYSGRFPSAESNEAYWELLRAGRDVHQEIPSDRFNWRTHYDESGKQCNTSRIKHGCFIDSPGQFDARFFSMSPREAENTDPAQRLAILTTYEAMEMAGFVRNRTPSTQEDRVGVFFGATSDDWRDINAAQDIGTYFVPGGNRAFATGRISYFFRLTGPSLVVDTACSSSLSAIQIACSYLWSGQCDTAIAGGMNILTNPNQFAGLDRGHFLSTTGNCNAFDDGADGYCRADGVGSVILKRLEDAETDNDPILGVIVGTNTNHCGHTDSITRPNEEDQAKLFQQILRRANYNPLDVSVIEMHGTGTQAGDAAEMSSVLSAFVPGRERTETHPARPLYIGSAKANVGHSESASGIMSLIKLLLMFKHNEIPPHCGIKTKLNRNYPLDLTKRGIRIASEPTPWARNPRNPKRIAFLNNFSAAGGNTALLLEEEPRMSEPIHDSRHSCAYLVAITAKSLKSLLGNARSLAAWLQQNSETALSDLSYTTTARRMHHNYRMMLSAETMPNLLDSLKSLVSQEPIVLSAIPSPSRKPCVIFTFTGQGSLYIGMGKELFVAYSSFRDDILCLEKLAQSYGFPRFVGLIDGSLDGDIHSMSAVTSHLALLCIQIALVKLLDRWGIKPSAVVGHSLGEYAALYAASVISAGDAMYLVGKRAMLLEKHCKRNTHGMLIVKGCRTATEEVLKSSGESFELACANHPAAHVVAGPMEDMPTIMTAADKKGIKTVKLDIPFAFHSSQVDPMLPEFKIAVRQAGITFDAPAIPVISPLLGSVVPKGEESVFNISYLVQASRYVLDFTTALNKARKHYPTGNTIWLEVGAHTLCGTMIKQTLGPEEAVLTTLRENVSGYRTMMKSIESLYLAGMDIDWNEYQRELPGAKKVLELPHYSWDLKNYWIDYKNDFCVNFAACGQKSESRGDITTHKYISPIAQKVIEEVHEQDISSMTVESDIFHAELLPILHGHVVTGASLCPSSLYAEIAFTLGDYLLRIRKLSPDTTRLELYDLDIGQPLIAKNGETSHMFRIKVKANWIANSLDLVIFSVDGSGTHTVPHAKLSVRVVSRQRWVSDWNRNAYLVKSRIKSLESGDTSQKLRRRMAYKLFATLVDYSDEFKGMSEVLLDSDDLEAVSTVQFQVEKERGGLGVDARWIDSLAQVSGFIMNATDAMNSKDQVFINHGWEKLRFAENLSASGTYRAYCRMQLVEKTTFIGDIFVLDGDRIICLYEGIKFVGMRRQVLQHLLSSKDDESRSNLSIITPMKFVSEAPLCIPRIQQNGAGVRSRLVEERPIGTHSSHIMEIISQETGIAICDLQLESSLADLGMDSLLSLTISSRIRSELHLDISSTTLMECTNISEVRELICHDDVFISSSATDSDNSLKTGMTQPAESFISSSTVADDSDMSESDQIRRHLWDIVAEETATAVYDLWPSTSVAGMGIDSLLSISISARLSERFSVCISSFSIMTCETLLDLELLLHESLGLERASWPRGSLEHNSTIHTGDATIIYHPELVSAPTSCLSVTTEGPQATSVCLSGSPSTAKLVMILFPDGSGSATSYANLPSKLPADVALYGLNCPWRECGLDLIRSKVTVPQMVARQVVEVCRILKNHRLHGWTNCEKGIPNLVLGGWSAGGVLALEAIRQLADEGIFVRKLLLLDSPNPIGLRPPSRKMSRFIEALGRFGGRSGKAPDWLLEHFDGMAAVLNTYSPSPLPTNFVLEALQVYARKGAWYAYPDPEMELQADHHSEISWLLRDRTDFTGDGWKRLIGSERFSVKVMDDVDHFTLLGNGKETAKLGTLLADFLARESNPTMAGLLC